MSDTCIVCRKELLTSMGGDGPPMDGLIFISHGNYGSTIYDPGAFEDADEFLRVVLCDACVARAAKENLVQKGQPQRRPETIYTPWPGNG